MANTTTTPSSLPLITQKCDRDSLSHIFSFLNAREFQVILRVNQEWNRVAHLKSSWPQFNTTQYIRQLVASPHLPPSDLHRSLSVINLPLLGRAHLTNISNEYLTRREEYQHMYNQTPDGPATDKSYISKIWDHHLRKHLIDQEVRRKVIFDEENKAGRKVFVKCIKKSRVHSFASMIELEGCNVESFDAVTACFPSLRAIRLKSHRIGGEIPAMPNWQPISYAYAQPIGAQQAPQQQQQQKPPQPIVPTNGYFDSQQMCDRIEVLESDTLHGVHLKQFRSSLRVLRTDQVNSVELRQLTQLEYLTLTNLSAEVARSIRYLSVKHQLRSLVLMPVNVPTSMLEATNLRNEIKRSADVLASALVSDITKEVTQDPTKEDSFTSALGESFPPATLTHLDTGSVDLSPTAFVSFCKLTSLRRFRGRCCLDVSLARDPIVKQFLGQLEYLDIESMEQVAIDRCSHILELRLREYPNNGLTFLRLPQLRDLTLDGLSNQNASAVSAVGIMKLPNLLERLTISCSGQIQPLLMEVIASAVAPLPHFHSLTLNQMDHQVPVMLISSRTIEQMIKSSSWSTLRLACHHNKDITKWQPTRPDQVWNMKASQEQLNENTDAITERVRKSFRLHLSQLELVFHIDSNKETGKSEWQLENQ